MTVFESSGDYGHRMGIAIKNRIDLKAKRRALMEKVDRRMEQALQGQATLIARNASMGMGFKNQALDDYSEGYQQARLKRGYSPAVNMTITGQMLRDVQAVVERSERKIEGRIFVAAGASVSPMSASGKAASSVDKARWTNEKRHWFGLSAKSKKYILERLKGA